MWADAVWILKAENSQNIHQFRITSLLTVEGKVFFSIVSWRLKEFLLKSSYIGTSVQEGRIIGAPGHRCVWNTQLIREAHEDGGDLAASWLDLTNASWSIQHKLAERALHHYVPRRNKDLILVDSENLRLRVCSGSAPWVRDWHHPERGIITTGRCTILGILFISDEGGGEGLDLSASSTKLLIGTCTKTWEISWFPLRTLLHLSGQTRS